MARVEMHLTLPAAAEAVWARIGGFGTLHEWHPAIEKTEMEGTGIGAQRNLFLAGGGNVVERLDAEDAAAHTYTYSILESPLPVAHYQATLQVKAEGADRCTVKWWSTFEPAGAAEADAVAVITGVYQAGFDGMQEAFGG